MEKVYQDMEDLEQKLNDIHLLVGERKWQEERTAAQEKEMEQAAKGGLAGIVKDSMTGYRKSDVPRASDLFGL